MFRGHIETIGGGQPVFSLGRLLVYANQSRMVLSQFNRGRSRFQLGVPLAQAAL